MAPTTADRILGGDILVDRILADLILAEAREWIGTPYCHGASLKGVGCDCLGLVRGVWRGVIGAEPEQAGLYAPDWAEAGRDERLRDAARRHLSELPLMAVEPGDVLLFRWRDGLPAKHLGILSAPGRMIHAHEGACVAEVGFGIWSRRLAHAFRFPSSGAPFGRTPPPPQEQSE